MNELREAINYFMDLAFKTEQRKGKDAALTMLCEKIIKYAHLAERALREKAERGNPQPLTIDELREMNGEPVWIEENGETECGVVSLEGNYSEKEPVITLANGNFYLLKEYNGKTWLAYRTKPEGSEQ